MCDAVSIGIAGVGLLGGGLNALGSYKSGQAKKAADYYAATVEEQNAKLSEGAAADALKAGGREAGAIRSKASQIIGQQTVGYAADGVDVNQSGSVATTAASTRFVSEQDAQTAKINAAKEAWGYEVKAANQRAQAEIDRKGGNNAALAGEIGAAGGVLSGVSSGAQLLRGMK